MSEKHKDYAGAKMGMWLFLFTELVLFGGLFLLFSVYLHRYQPDFHHAAKSLDVVFGGANTVVLLTSSLCVALSISALQRNQRGRSLFMLALTIAFALAFLVNKGFEWGAKFDHGLFPGSPHMASLPRGEEIFFGLYFAMTGLHGIHVLVGATLLSVVFKMIMSGRVNSHDYVILENSGLYWHLVDVIWIYLFPLFYLIT